MQSSRPSAAKMLISDYKNHFEQLSQRLKNFKIKPPSVMLAYQLPKNANSPKLLTQGFTRATPSQQLHVQS